MKTKGIIETYYSGYLGEINYNDNSVTDLYVNLRCMQIQKNNDNFQAHLFVGLWNNKR
jgi:hypothetical protein